MMRVGPGVWLARKIASRSEQSLTQAGSKRSAVRLTEMTLSAMTHGEHSPSNSTAPTDLDAHIRNRLRNTETWWKNIGAAHSARSARHGRRCQARRAPLIDSGGRRLIPGRGFPLVGSRLAGDRQGRGGTG